MPILKSPQQEKFAQLVASEKSHYEAYLEAYPTSVKWERNSVDSKASQLSSDAKVMQRINELKEELKNKIQDKLVYTALESFKELERLKQLALTNTGNTGKADVNVAVKAEELKGKLASLYVEEKKITIKDFTEEVEYL